MILKLIFTKRQDFSLWGKADDFLGIKERENGDQGQLAQGQIEVRSGVGSIVAATAAANPSLSKPRHASFWQGIKTGGGRLRICDM